MVVCPRWIVRSAYFPMGGRGNRSYQMVDVELSLLGNLYMQSMASLEAGPRFA